MANPFIGPARNRAVARRLTQRQGQGPAALRILDQAEKDLGPSPELQLARLDYWGLEGGAAAQAAVAKLAEDRQRIPTADRPAFLDRLASVELRLGNFLYVQKSIVRGFGRANQLVEF